MRFVLPVFVYTTLAHFAKLFPRNLSLDTNEGVMVMSEHIADTTLWSLHDRIFRWLSAPDPFQSYEEARQKRLSRTGDWFIEHCEYTKWKNEPKSLLWLHGITGFGKIVLSSTIVEDLGEHCQGHIGHALAYFYFESNSTSDSTALLRSVLSQLSRPIKTGMPKLIELYHSCDKGRRQPSNDALSATLKGMFQSTPATYILLDALDECQNRSKLLDLIQTINDWQLDNLHLLVTSRPEADITEVIAPLAGPEGIIKLAPSPVNDDISNHIQNRLSLDRNLRRWRSRPDVQERISKRLLVQGDGMYGQAVTARLCYC